MSRSQTGRGSTGAVGANSAGFAPPRRLRSFSWRKAVQRGIVMCGNGAVELVRVGSALSVLALNVLVLTILAVNGLASPSSGAAGSGAAGLGVGRLLKAPSPVEVHWRGDEFAPNELPSELGIGPAEAVASWADWAEEHGYRMDLSDDGRVLLLVEGKRLDKRAWKLVSRSLAAFDQLLPEPIDLDVAAHDASAQRRTSAPSSPAQIDPGETLVLAAIDNQRDHEAMLAHLVELQPYLETWAGHARSLVGFTLERPLVAAWQTKPSGVEEWDPSNELVHRLGTLLVHRNFGHMPHWLSRGLAWSLEIDVRGNVACFPDRSSFVFAVEHTSWPNTAKQLAKSKLKSKESVRLEDLAAWKPGQWNGDTAVLAWAVSDWLARESPGLLPGILRQFEAARVAGATTHFPDGTWRTVENFQLDAAAQGAIFADALGVDFVADWTAALAKTRRG